MTKTSKLTKRQRAVIADLFLGEMDEQDILDKHQVSRALYDRWLADGRFAAELEERIARAHRQSRLILARYATLAATRLVALTQCEKEETVRRACLDIIALHPPVIPIASPGNPRAADTAAEPDLSPETASRLLAALAQESTDEQVTVSQ